MKVNTDDLFEAVWSVTGDGVVTAIFDPVEKGFNWLVYIIQGAEDSVVFLQIRGGDVGVGGVQVIQDSKCGVNAVSNFLVLEGADEHFVNSSDKNMLESLVGAIVLIEECRGGVKIIAKFGDLGASGVGWDYGYRSRVDGHDEGGVQQGVVDDG